MLKSEIWKMINVQMTRARDWLRSCFRLTRAFVYCKAVALRSVVAVFAEFSAFSFFMVFYNYIFIFFM